MRAYVLMGGGIDSTTIIPFLKAKSFRVIGIHFDYGQPAATMEQEAVRAVARYYDVELLLETLRPSVRRNNGSF